MTLFSKLKEPVLIKQHSDLEFQLNKMKEIKEKLNSEGKKLIEQDMKKIEYGLIGEKQIEFELMNSHIPMYVIRDLHLKSQELTAQIDFFVITRKLNLIIECKNLFGDITITEDGQFIRKMTWGNRSIKEGLYSPITQNKRHLDLLKKIRIDNASNTLIKFTIDKTYDDFFKSIIVLANPKTVLNDKYAPKDIKNQIIRADQLVDYIHTILNNSKELKSSDKEMELLADKYLKMDMENEVDYLAKYEQYLDDNHMDSELLLALREYRTKKSKEQEVKAYYIFNNATLDELVARKPKTIADLKNVSGFGEVKCNQYGVDITRIINSFS